MLNRRILRVKAFQNLYGYSQCKSSNFQLAKDFVYESFQPDLNTMEIQDKSQLKKEAERCVKLFSESLRNPVLITNSVGDQKAKAIAMDAINLFHKYCEKDLVFLRKNMLAATERIPQLYLYAIQILVGFGEHVQSEFGKRRKFSTEKTQPISGEQNLAKNKILEFLKSVPSIQAELIRQHVHMGELELEIKEWYRDYVKNLEEYQDYIQLSEPGLEEDNKILQIILKRVIFKNDTILSFFYEKDLNWSENKSVVRSLALKVLKGIEDVSDINEYTLPEIAINWEEDKEFFQNIFNLTIQYDDEHKELIAQRTKNWDIERIANTDKIIISMALTEMVHFPSIPTKVTINEYIDISKTYSTPKSKQFVNGILDVLSKELTESGKIRKSGRGLLDNK